MCFVLLNNVFIVFCNICFLFLVIKWGVICFFCFFRWLFLFKIFLYKLLRLVVVNLLLFSGIIGCKFGGMIGIIFIIIYLGLLFDWLNVLIIFKCLIIWLCFCLEFVLRCFFKFLIFLFKFRFWSNFLIVLVLVSVVNFELYFLISKE